MRTALTMLVAAGLVLAACTTPRPMVVQYRHDVDLTAYKTVFVVVDASEYVVRANGLDIASSELRSKFIEHLRATGKFLVLERPPAEGKAAEVRLTIRTLNYVSGEARGGATAAPLVGATFVGKASLAVVLNLRDREGGEVLFTLSASQTEHPRRQNPFTGTTSSQISDVSKELAERLARAVKTPGA